MRRSLTHATASLLALSAVLATQATTGARAQAVIDLDEITVSANLVPTEIQRSGASVSIIDRDQIEASGATQVSDLLSRLPGVNATRTGGPGTLTSLRIRGADPRYSAVFVDGIRIDDPSSIQAQTDFGHLTLDDVERIEVLRGSQSALYGGSAVAGVINITTRQAEQDGLQQRTFVEGGSFRSAAAGYALTFRDARLQTALNLTHRQSRGFSAWEGVPGTPGFSTDNDPDGFRSTRLSFSARYAATDRLTLGVSAFLQRSRNDYDNAGDDADNVARWRQIGGRAFAEYDAEFGTQTFGISHYRIERQLIAGFGGDFTGDRTVLDWQGVTTLGGGTVTLVYGADWQREGFQQVDAFNDIDTSVTIAGGFLQTLINPREGLDVSLAARVDRHSRFGTFVTGRAALAFAATDSLTLRGQIARGFRAPSQYELFAPGFGNPDLEAERSLTGEIGLDYRAADGLRLSATLFNARIDNLIGFSAGQYDQELGRTRLRGIELSGRFEVNDRLSLNAAYTFTDARDPSGARREMVHRHELFLGAEALLAEHWRGTLGLTYVAGRPDQLDRSQFPAPAVSMSNYVLVNAGLRFAATDTADIYLRVDNVLNRQYQQVVGYATPGRSFHIGVAARF